MTQDTSMYFVNGMWLNLWTTLYVPMTIIQDPNTRVLQCSKTFCIESLTMTSQQWWDAPNGQLAITKHDLWAGTWHKKHRHYKDCLWHLHPWHVCLLQQSVSPYAWPCTRASMPLKRHVSRTWTRSIKLTQTEQSRFYFCSSLSQLQPYLQIRVWVVFSHPLSLKSLSPTTNFHVMGECGWRHLASPKIVQLKVVGEPKMGDR